VQAIAICTTNAKCLPVMLASITFYVPTDVTVFIAGSDMVLPRHRTINLPNPHKNFGDAYNAVMQSAYQEFDEVVIANDDVVLTPYTWPTLSKEVSQLKRQIKDLGYVACRSDYARGYQNLRLGEGPMSFFRYESESKIIEVDVIAPIFAYIHKNNWISFPPINWYSDDIQCLDMKQTGQRHFISTAYVHHVGSQTCGNDGLKCIRDAQPWIEENRPELAELWFKKKD
jgi:hypothetical protein